MLPISQQHLHGLCYQSLSIVQEILCHQLGNHVDSQNDWLFMARALPDNADDASNHLDQLWSGNVRLVACCCCSTVTQQ